MSLNKESSIPPWKGVSFSCGGWLQFYLFGVARAMQVRGLDKNVKVSGCSAGALAAAGLALGGDFDKAVEQCKIDCVPSARGSFYGMFEIPRYIVDSCKIGNFLHRWNTVEAGELQVAVTGLPFLTQRRIQEFTSEEDLTKCLLASCAIFPLAQLVYYRGCWNIDGGITDFVPDVQGVDAKDTISVSPFHISYCDIKPSRYIPFWWAIVPPNSPDTIDWIYALGYEDGIRYIDKRLSECSSSCATVESEQRTRRIQTRSSASSISTGNASVGSQNPREVSYRYTNDLSTEGHEHYGHRGNISMYRFMGYRMFPFKWLEMCFDAFLIFFLVTVWKPLIISLIYLELFLKVGGLFVGSLVTELQDWFSTTTIVIATVFMLPQWILLTTMTLAVYIRKLLISGPSAFNIPRYESIYKCIQCIGSVALLSKIISGVPVASAASNFHDTHEILDEVSFIYRLCKHII
jgi:hypothetical protein